MSVERRRILFVINDLKRAGAEKQLVELALSLDPSAWEIVVVVLKKCNDFDEQLRTGGIPVVTLRRRGFWDVGLLFRLMRVMRRLRPDIVHSYLFLANAWSAVAGRLIGVPAVIVSQRCSYNATLGPFWRRVARLSHRLADRVLVNSKAALEEERRAGFGGDPLVFVPNGLRPSPPFDADRRALRERLNLQDRPLVLAVGQLVPIKGHRILVEAWPEVVASRPDANLVLIGEGSERNALAARAHELGIQVMLLGFQSPVQPFLAACDVFVQPSLSEGMPNTVLEAMAAGRPVVASRAGGIPELVIHGETGLLVPPRDPKALAAAIIRLLEEVERAALMGDRGLERVQSLFSMHSARERIEAIYRELIGRVTHSD